MSQFSRLPLININHFSKLRNLLCNEFKRNNLSVQRMHRRSYSAPPKRFYRKVNILQSDDAYEIILDQKKLKTPNGSIFKVDNEALALAIVTEWDSQKEVIQQNNMHLTALCSTVIDNPNNLTKFDMVQRIISFLDTDTILFHSKEEIALYELQQREWQPHINWFCKSFEVKLEPSVDIGGPQVTADTKAQIQRHLLSYNFAAIHGFLFAIEALKSLILTHACVERRLNVDKAVLLSRLEEEYQCGHWGRVEWAHDLSQLDLQSRVAAAVLFVHLNSSSEHIVAKKKLTQ